MHVAGKLATRSHVLARGGNHRLNRRMAHCFMTGSLLAGRSGGDDLDGGVVGRR